MYRVTTPTHAFQLPQRKADISIVHLDYKQNGTVILEKIDNGTRQDFTYTEVSPEETPAEEKLPQIASVTLTQAETKLFNAGRCQVQLRILTTGGVAMASNKLNLTVEDVLCDTILGVTNNG